MRSIDLTPTGLVDAKTRSVRPRVGGIVRKVGAAGFGGALLVSPLAACSGNGTSNTAPTVAGTGTPSGIELPHQAKFTKEAAQAQLAQLATSLTTDLADSAEYDKQHGMKTDGQHDCVAAATPQDHVTGDLDILSGWVDFKDFKGCDTTSVLASHPKAIDVTAGVLLPGNALPNPVYHASMTLGADGNWSVQAQGTDASQTPWSWAYGATPAVEAHMVRSLAELRALDGTLDLVVTDLHTSTPLLQDAVAAPTVG